MIEPDLVVIVAFTMLTGTYIFVRSVADNEATLKEWKDEIETSQATGLIPSLIVKEIRRMPYPL